MVLVAHTLPATEHAYVCIYIHFENVFYLQYLVIVLNN